MERKIKLSPAMQAEMWNLHSEETGGPVMAGTTDATAHALSRRGLFSLATRRLTDAGRAWIAEQVDAAYVEALDEDRLRETIALHREVGATYATDRQRNIARSLEIIAMPREMDSKRTDVA